MTRSPEPSRIPDGACARRSDALAWLQGELPAPAGTGMARHVACCADCAAFVRDARGLLGALGDERDVTRARGSSPPPDLAQRVLLGCDGELRSARLQVRRRKRMAVLAVAALLLVTFSLHVVLQATETATARRTFVAMPAVASLVAAAPTSAVPVVLAPSSWRSTSDAGAPASDLAARLLPDGRFDAADDSGPRANEVGLHGLALLALASEAPSPDTRDATRRAAHWLLEQQEDDGAIGAPAGAGFDHAIATAALLEAAALTGDADVRRGAERAIAHIVACQASDGGWEPRIAGRPGSTPAHTAWTLAALMRARELGGADLQAPIARGQSRLAADLGPGGARGADCAHAAPDLAAVRAVALGGISPRGGAPLGELHAASIAVLASPLTAR